MSKSKKDYKNKKQKARLKRMKNRVDGTYSYYPSSKV